MAGGRDVLITGGTGYVGRALSAALVARGHRVRVLTRERSRGRVVTGAQAVVGDALDPQSIRAALRPGDVVVHLVGTPNPGPGKAAEFQRVDLTSVQACARAARDADIAHVVYVSVAHPAPVMRDYIAVRMEGERLLREAGVAAVLVRPWYILGPGHRWPSLLLPLYALARIIPALRAGAERCGLVTLEQMVRALVRSVEEPLQRGDIRVVDVPAIRDATYGPSHT